MRKKFLLNKPFQLSIIAWFSLLSVILVSIFYSTIWYFFYKFKEEAISTGLPESHVFFTFLKEQKMVIDQIFLYSSGFAIVIILFGGIFISHKVAGPLHQLNEHLKNYNKGNIPPLKFRKNDYFLDIQDTFNEFIKKD